jgi:hypothetical protein
MDPFETLLKESAAIHGHLCPGPLEALRRKRVFFPCQGDHLAGHELVTCQLKKEDLWC